MVGRTYQMNGSAEETAKKVFGVSGNTRRLGGGMRQCRKVFGSAKKVGYSGS